MLFIICWCRFFSLFCLYIFCGWMEIEDGHGNKKTEWYEIMPVFLFFCSILLFVKYIMSSLLVVEWGSLWRDIFEDKFVCLSCKSFQFPMKLKKYIFCFQLYSKTRRFIEIHPNIITHQPDSVPTTTFHRISLHIFLKFLNVL